MKYVFIVFCNNGEEYEDYREWIEYVCESRKIANKYLKELAKKHHSYNYWIEKKELKGETKR